MSHILSVESRNFFFNEPAQKPSSSICFCFHRLRGSADDTLSVFRFLSAAFSSADVCNLISQVQSMNEKVLFELHETLWWAGESRIEPNMHHMAWLVCEKSGSLFCLLATLIPNRPKNNLLVQSTLLDTSRRAESDLRASRYSSKCHNRLAWSHRRAFRFPVDFIRRYQRRKNAEWTGKWMIYLHFALALTGFAQKSVTNGVGGHRAKRGKCRIGKIANRIEKLARSVAREATCSPRRCFAILSAVIHSGRNSFHNETNQNLRQNSSGE